MNTNGLSFQNPTVEKLYVNDFSIDQILLQEIISSSATTPDLLAIVADSFKNPAFYTREGTIKSGGAAPFHAVMALHEQKADAVMPSLIDFFKGDVLVLDDVFGVDFLTDDAWSFVCHLGKKYLKELEMLIFEGEVDIYVKLAITSGLAQMANSYPETRPEVLKIFSKLVKFYISDESLDHLAEEEPIFEGSDFDADIEFLSDALRDILKINPQELSDDIDECFAQDIVDEAILALEDVNYKNVPKKPLVLANIYKTLLEKDADGEDILDLSTDEDIIKPKIKKMK